MSTLFTNTLLLPDNNQIHACELMSDEKKSMVDEYRQSRNNSKTHNEIIAIEHQNTHMILNWNLKTQSKLQLTKGECISANSTQYQAA